MKQVALLQAGGISQSTVVHFMSLARQAMEAHSLKDQFPTAAMYCDWSLHAKLDRRQAHDLLDHIDEHINSGYLQQAAAAQARKEGGGTQRRLRLMIN
jgi:hypothetical protein